MPDIDGKPSELYKALLKEFKNDRPLTNYIYASYLQEGVADAMDKVKDKNGNPKYKRNNQGQHRLKDVYEFFNIKQMLKDTHTSTIDMDAKELGTKDASFDYIDFKDSEEAFNKAINYNASHTGRLAYVIYHNDGYRVIIENTNAMNIHRKALLDSQIKAWETFKQALKDSNIDIKELMETSNSTLSPINLLEYLKGLEISSIASNFTLGVQDIKNLLIIGKGLPKVNALLTRWKGESLDEIANKVYEIIQNSKNVANSTKALVDNALTSAKKESPFKAKSVYKEITEKILPEFNKTNEASLIQAKIKELENEYNLGSDTLLITSKEVKTLEDAAALAVATIEREIRNLEKKGSEASKEARKIKDILLRELTHKRYHYGLTLVLERGLKYAEQIKTILDNVPNSANIQDFIREASDATRKAVLFREGYYHIIDALTNINSLTSEEIISKEEREKLQEQAKTVKEILDNQEKVIKSYQEQIIVKCLQEYLGTDNVTQLAIAEITEIIKNDTGYTDFLYSIGNSSNEVIACVGTIIRNSQIERDKKLTDVSVRIKKATKKLYDSGYTSDFMYKSDGSIITKEGIDWDAYYKARSKEIRELDKLGFKGFELQEALKEWEELNTIEKVVDAVSERTERIPNDLYRLPYNEYNELSDEQKEYYDTMMQIKGELETLLPDNAQHCYTPPQLRKNWVDVVRDAFKGDLTPGESIRLLLDRMKFWKIREDDTDFITKKYSNYDNTVLREVPVFYQNKVNRNELLTDFSAAIQSLASTAFNYEAMEGIRTVVEIFQDVIGNASVEGKNPNGTPYVDTVSNSNFYRSISNKVKNIWIKTFAKKAGESNAKAMLDSYIDYHLYNEKYKGNKKANKWVNSLLSYNSVTRLALNVLSYTSNIIQGDLQMLIEAGGGKYYNRLHLLKAHARLFGDLAGRTPGKIWDNLTGSRSNLDTLIGEFFDVQADNYSNKSRERYYKNPFRRLFGDVSIMGAYSSGEYLIRTTNMYAILYKEKVLLNSKKVSLIDALDKTDKEGGFSDLILKKGITKLDGSSLTLDDKYFTDLKKKIKAVSDDCFGSMNAEDKGMIHQHMLGRMAMSFRQWMVGHYSRRYRKKHWNAAKQEFEEGYWRTEGKRIWEVSKLLWSFFKGAEAFEKQQEILQDFMTEDAKVNCRKARNEFVIFATLLVLNFFFGNGNADEEDEDSWLERFGTLMLKRTYSEFSAGLPTGIITESQRLLKSPLPVTTTIMNMFYPIQGIFWGDLVQYNFEEDKFEMTELQSGRYKGTNKYLRNLGWYTLPYYKQIDQLMHLEEEDALFLPYEHTRK